MTFEEFKNLAQKDLPAAREIFLDRKMDEWMNDGEEEVRRVLLLWAKRGTNPFTWDVETLLEEAEMNDWWWDA